MQLSRLLGYTPASIGKTAIALEIARQKNVVATFFFNRSDSDASRTDVNRLFPTLAWQLAVSIPDIKDHIIHSINKYSDLPKKRVEEQFEYLVAQPFAAMKKATSAESPSGLVVIIDGIDECADIGLRRRILKVIRNAVLDRRVPLRFIICSRPDAQIQNIFDQLQCPVLSIDLAEFHPAEEIRKREAKVRTREEELKEEERKMKDRVEEIEKKENEIERREEETLHRTEEIQQKAGEIKRREEELMKREEELKQRDLEQQLGTKPQFKESQTFRLLLLLLLVLPFLLVLLVLPPFLPHILTSLLRLISSLLRLLSLLLSSLLRLLSFLLSSVLWLLSVLFTSVLRFLFPVLSSVLRLLSFVLRHLSSVLRHLFFLLSYVLQFFSSVFSSVLSLLPYLPFLLSNLLGVFSDLLSSLDPGRTFFDLLLLIIIIAILAAYGNTRIPMRRNMNV
ncbi:hypothetical protein JOM56_011930 [Amanita muscaria]